MVRRSIVRRAHVAGASIIRARIARASSGIIEQLERRVLFAAAAGDLDSTFGTGGVLRDDVAGGADLTRAITVDAQGRTIILGDAEEPANSGTRTPVRRYLGNGAIDTSFGGGDGKVYFGDSINEFSAPPWQVRVQSDGKIVGAGRVYIR